jgi:hypothetical protein
MNTKTDETILRAVPYSVFAKATPTGFVGVPFFDGTELSYFLPRLFSVLRQVNTPGVFVSGLVDSHTGWYDWRGTCVCHGPAPEDGDWRIGPITESVWGAPVRPTNDFLEVGIPQYIVVMGQRQMSVGLLLGGYIPTQIVSLGMLEYRGVHKFNADETIAEFCAMAHCAILKYDAQAPSSLSSRRLSTYAGYN